MPRGLANAKILHAGARGPRLQCHYNGQVKGRLNSSSRGSHAYRHSGTAQQLNPSLEELGHTQIVRFPVPVDEADRGSEA
mmetsp:Transcript_43997/g.80396  ORF Transcript_43997/g.80396 Transcript_43997/m.80396 type:complete len:80 (+) Transcript_43997:64-303(+)